MTTLNAKPGLFSRLATAGSFIMRGSLPLTSENIARYFPGIGGGRAGGPTRSYSQVSVVHACVKVRMEAIAGMPLNISTGDDELVETGPLVELTECPNPGMTRRTFWSATSAILDLFGKCYFVMLLDSLRRPIEVYPVSELQLKPIVNRSTGEITGYKYLPAGRLRGQEEILELDQVHVIIDPDFENPSNPLNGLSPRHAVASAISQFYKADVANEASLDNGVEPGGALQTEKELSESQIKGLRAELDEHHTGVQNRRRLLLLQGGMAWNRIGASFNEMEFSELKKMSRADICAGFCVPGPVLNYFEDSNYAHANAAQESFWLNTILPRAARLAEEWQLAVMSRYQADRSLAMDKSRSVKINRKKCCTHGFIHASRAAKNSSLRFYAWFDSSEIHAVQLAALAVTDQAAKWWGMGTPLNNLYSAFNVPFPEVPYGSTGYRPIGLEAYGTDTMDTIDHPPVNPGSEEDSALIPEGDTSKGRDVSRAGLPGVVKATEATRAKLWAIWVKSWQPLERKAHDQLKRHFYELRGQVLAALERVKDQLPEDTAPRSFTAGERRDVIGSVLFNLEEANKGLIAKVGPLIRESYRLGGEQSMQEAANAKGTPGTPDTPDPFNINDPTTASKMRARTVNLTNLNKTVSKRVARVMADALDNGRSYGETVEALKKEFNFTRTRAATIARTEIGASVEEARSEGRNQAGVPMKSWLASRKETGRPQHLATESETAANPIQNDAPFTIAGSGVTCQHPRASNLPAGQSVNCGCTTLARYPGDNLKAVLARYSRGFLTYDQLTARDGSRLQSKDAPDGK